jgi:hypothetical protein
MEVLSAVVAELDPDCVDGRDAADLYGSFAGMERLAVAGKTLLAPRIESSLVWRETGHRNAAVLLADLEGVSPGQAGATLTLGRRLEALPGTQEEVRKGTLSTPKVAELVDAGVVDPGAELDLVAGAADAPLQAVKDRCRKSRATAVGADPLAGVRRIHASRRFTSWTDPEGAFCFQGRDTADRGAQILSRLGATATCLRKAAKAAGGPSETERAYMADAFHALLTENPGPSSLTGGSSPPSSAPHPSCPPDRSVGRKGGSPHPGGKESRRPTTAPSSGADPSGALETGAQETAVIDRPPACSVVVRVDLAALLRGRAHPGECCAIDNVGPIPVPMARSMANDSYLRYLFHQAGDIRAVSHFGRTINRSLRTALLHRDPTCVVPGCGISTGLEIDHIIPFAEGGPTALDNLARLCHHHHFLKTYEGWDLTRIGTDKDGTPQWSFTPPPAFGHEPGLGIDTDEGRESWTRQRE